MSAPKHFYVTTPIYYVNDAPHIGHAYTTTLADVLTRYHKLAGEYTFFLTGTDEHGQKVQQAAAKRGVTPREQVDQYNLRFKEMWARMGMGHDHFIRTTDTDHKEYVQECLQQLWDRQEIYAKEYEGWYSVGEERFFSEEELVDGKDPISGRPVEWLKEKNYFFKMGSYQKKLIDHIESNPDFILPDFRRNEVLGFLRQSLNDLCISRPKSRLSWGIELPFDRDFVCYVWFDALLNYVSAVRNRKFPDGSAIWPATYHLIGKDILTTHSVYWPTMLMGLGLPLPKHILAHGWWMIGGSKMSKSAGTGVNPMDLMAAHGVDAFRYFLAREMVVGQDAAFSEEAFVRRINSDLANDLGNGLNRVHRLALTNFDGKVPAPGTGGSEAELELRTMAERTISLLSPMIAEIKLSQFIEEVLQLVRAVNRYLEQSAPWKLAKDPEQKGRLASVLYTGCETVRIALSLLHPVMPAKCSEGLQMLGSQFQGLPSLAWGVLQGGEILGQATSAQGLFPRIEDKTEGAPAAKVAQAPQAKPLATEQIPAALELKVAKILSVAEHPDAQSLYVLSVDAGEASPRTVCAGLRKSYSPEQLQDKIVLLFANLKPAPLRSIMSQGMLLAGDGEEGKAVLVEPPSATLGSRAQFQGIAPLAESRELKLKDFEKVSLSVQNGSVVCNGAILAIQGQPVTCPVANGAGVH